jgi:hypothetical protein
VRAAAMYMVFDHALRLSTESRGKGTVGSVTNLMSIDSERLFLGTVFLHWMWHTQCQITATLLCSRTLSGLSPP